MICCVACVETHEPVPPDAQPQQPVADACVREPSDGCCELLPDEEALRECIKQQTQDTPGCGVYLCWQSDCTLQRYNFCN